MAVKTISVFLLLALAVGSHSAKAPASIADYLVAIPGFKNLLGAANASGLIATLQDKKFAATLFLPTDSAFTKVALEFNVSLGTLFSSPALVKEVLLGHVIGGKAIASTDLKVGSTTAPTLSGYNITVIKTKKGSVSVIDSANRTANVVIPNVKVGKSIVHVIDNVLLPLDMVELARGAAPKPGPSPSLVPSPSPTTSLTETLGGAGLSLLPNLLSAVLGTSTLSGLANVTFLAPDDTAFASLIAIATKMGIAIDPNNLSPTIKGLLTGILQTHVIPGSHPAASLHNGDVLTALSSAKLAVDLKSNPGKVQFQVTTVPSSVATVTQADIKGPNGIIIHKIDAILSNVDLSALGRH